jgi:hypothetical protein
MSDEPRKWWTEADVKEALIAWDPTEANCYDKVAATQTAAYANGNDWSEPGFVSGSEVYYVYDILKWTRNSWTDSGHYKVERDPSADNKALEGEGIVVKTCEEGPEGEPLFWTGKNITAELIRKLEEVLYE